MTPALWELAAERGAAVQISDVRRSATKLGTMIRKMPEIFFMGIAMEFRRTQFFAQPGEVRQSQS
jgi:hypothetical protein